MIRTPTPAEDASLGNEKLMELADFLQQDEQDFLHSIETELDKLIKEPSDEIVQKILVYARLL